MEDVMLYEMGYAADITYKTGVIPLFDMKL